MEQIITMILKDRSARTEIETAYALQSMQKEHRDLFGDKMAYKPFKYIGPEKSSFEYKGHFCGEHDALLTLSFDNSGILEKNVAAFYVMYPMSVSSEYYDVELLRNKYETERIEGQKEKKISSAMEKMF